MLVAARTAAEYTCLGVMEGGSCHALSKQRVETTYAKDMSVDAEGRTST